jgi:transcriptional regulator with XRE-family HTH domain
MQPVAFDSAAFGRRLRRTRRDDGLSQEQLADCIGVRQSFLSDLERGVQRDLQVNTLVLLCQALGASADTLLGLPAPPGPLADHVPVDNPTPPRRTRTRSTP